MLTVAVGWQVYDLTRSALTLGLVGLAQFLPQFLLTLVVGQVADRFERRRVIILCQTTLLLTCVALALGSRHGLLTEPAMMVLHRPVASLKGWLILPPLAGPAHVGGGGPVLSRNYRPGRLPAGIFSTTLLPARKWAATRPRSKRP